MNLLSYLPLVALLISVWLIMKKPRTPKNLSRSMAMALLGFCLLAYFGNDIAGKDDNIFWVGFGLLTVYCITVVPFLMHLTSAIRQRIKMQRKEQND
jgi:drug/metabolite transporter (DMT)-like permease